MNANTIPLAVINPDAPADSLEAKQPHIDNGTQCYAKEGYFSREYMAREWERMWTRSWLIAGVESDLPRVGDFRGLNSNSFDGRGNYTMGLKDHLIFPEVDYSKVDRIKGMNISIVTTAKSDEEGRRLLDLLGVPFQRRT